MTGYHRGRFAIGGVLIVTLISIAVLSQRVTFNGSPTSKTDAQDVIRFTLHVEISPSSGLLGTAMTLPPEAICGSAPEPNDPEYPHITFCSRDVLVQSLMGVRFVINLEPLWIAHLEIPESDKINLDLMPDAKEGVL
jgi:hypothetical protein